MIKIVDLIIPTYKARETLPRALDSLVAQTKKLFIVTIVQDCDGEDYSDILDEYRRRGLKIRLLQMDQNRGPGLARQYGMDKDTMCKYFMFMDSDDMLNPRAIEILTQEAEKNDADVISSDFMVNIKGQPSFVMNVEKTPCTWTHAKIYKAAYLREKNIRFDPTLRLNEDSYFNLVAINCAERKFKIHEITYLWHQNQNSLTRQGGDLGFFVKSWAQYLYSQVQGLIDITEKTEMIDPGLVAATFLNMYTHHMKAESKLLREKCNEKDYSFVESQIGRLKSNEKIMSCINSKQFWTYVEHNLKGCETFGNALIFYKLRFCDWLKIYVMGENNEGIHS